MCKGSSGTTSGLREAVTRVVVGSWVLVLLQQMYAWNHVEPPRSYSHGQINCSATR